MDINAHTTQQTASSTSASSQNSAGRAAGIFGDAGAQNFLDIIFAHLTQKAENGDSENTHPLFKSLTDKLAQGSDQLTSKPDYEGHQEPLSTQHILQSVLEADLSTDIEIGTADTGELSAENIANQTGPLSPELLDLRQKLSAFLSSLTEGLPQESKQNAINLSTEIKKIFGRLQIEVGSEDSAELIATGLSPEQLTKLIEDIANGDEQGAAVIAGAFKIVSPDSKKQALFIPRGGVTGGPAHPAGELGTAQSAPFDDNTIMKLNALTPGSNEGSLEESDFDNVLRVLERAQGKAAIAGKDVSALDKALNAAEQKISAGLSTVQGTPPALTEIFTSFSVDSIYPDGLDLAGAPGQSTSLNSIAQSASLSGQAHQAGMPHPATQIVATAIAKATTNGETRNITIHLEPPALGKVRISMDFSTEKNTAKALLVAEKPETFLMLQRDAQLLEKALQEAGLDMDGSSLEFELSQDGNMFEQDEHSTGGNFGGGDDSEINEDGEEIEIIETTMDWYVDPDSGLMRYDALV